MYKLFVDLDGVLVDFESGVLRVTGRRVEEQSPREMWSALARSRGFYDSLDWLPDGRELWDFCLRHEPTILTGLPFGNWAAPQKLSWCARELGPDVPVITCFSRQKAARAREACPDGLQPVLVDDRARLRDSFEEAGGVFVHHRTSAESIIALKELGF